MITITKNGNAVLFEFEENSHYLFNGTIEVPLNSLTLVTDESEMFTFKKAATNDIFISARYDDVNMSKSQLIDFYIANMVGGGGSESGVTSGEVQTMINTSLEDYYDKDEVDAAVSGKADSSAVTQEISAAVSGKADSSAVTEAITAAVSGKQDTLIAGSGITISGNVISSEAGNNVIELTQAEYDALVDKDPSAFYIITDAEEINISDYYTSAQTQSAINAAVSGKADSSAVTQEISAAVSGKVDTNAFNTYSAATNARLAEDEEVTAAAFNDFNEALSGKADTSAVTAALSGKQDTLIAGDNITISGNVISAEGGGKAVNAGTNISITTGETADTINCTLPISAGTGSQSIIAATQPNYPNEATANGAIALNGYGFHRTLATGVNSLAQGNDTHAQGECSHAEGSISYAIGYASHSEGNSTYAMTDYSHAEGASTKTTNKYEHASGLHNISVSASTTFGDSGNTLFSVGNGALNNKHNAFEIRQDGSILIADLSNGTSYTDRPMIKLQDALGGGSITIDPTLDSGSTNAVANSAITSQFNSIDARLSEDEEVTAAALNALNDKIDAIDITVDDALDATSENPVQNKVIYAVIGNIESLLSNI